MVSLLPRVLKMPYKNPETAKAHFRAYREKHREEIREYNKKYYRKIANDPVKYKELLSKIRTWRRANPERAYAWEKRNPEKHAQYVKSWQARNRSKGVSIVRARQLRKCRAMPKWLDQDDVTAIDRFYEQAVQYTVATGIPHAVDHIVPITGKNVSGLHVPWNLQILTRSENSKKSNLHVD